MMHSSPAEEAMKATKAEARMLQTAFSQFNATSFELEQSYRHLKNEVNALQEELKKRNEENQTLREEAERNQRLRAVGEMAARMAHELRNPLGAIELFASLLKKSFSASPQDSEKLEWATHLSSAVRTMDYAITNLLLFTRKPTAHVQSVNLREIIHELFLFIKPLLEQNRIESHQACEGLPQMILCDEHLIRQALLNLILNAIDAMPQGGRLVISSSALEGESLEINLTDTGTGIPKALRSRIFDPFFTTKGKGTGLGLSIAQNAILAHGGLLQMSTQEGLGTTFTLSLPTPKPEKNK